MKLEEFGWEKYRINIDGIDDIELENVARIAVENRGGYLLFSGIGELEGILRGNFLKAQKFESQFPKVGDWVVFEKIQGEKKAVIVSILPRRSKISRRRAAKDREAVWDKKEEQIIATNIDLVFVVQGLDGDFNLSRLERYVAMAIEGGCRPVILLNKSDIVVDDKDRITQIRSALPEVEVHSISAKEKVGIEKVVSLIEKGTSAVFVGSSGAGKSTLINALLGFEKQKIGEIREDDSKGKHTTTKREMILFNSGGILIDTPGMRELGMWVASDSVIDTFVDIKELVGRCKFNDCDHQFSKGCAIIEEVSKGDISEDRYRRFLKINNELDPLKSHGNSERVSAQKRARGKITKRSAFGKKNRG